MAIPLARLALEIVRYDSDRRRANHFLKVAGYASVIGGEEGLSDREHNRLQAACLLHDVGIRESLARHGSAAGEYQEAEGPPIAREILRRLETPEEDRERICWLIAHHHQTACITDLDHQILVEADFLVNCDEGGWSPEQIVAVRKRVFRTRAGTELLDALFFPERS